MNKIVAEIGRAGDTKAAAARPKKKTEILESCPACCTECLSTEFRKRGKRCTKRKGKVQTYNCYRCNTRFVDPAAHCPACRQGTSPAWSARTLTACLTRRLVTT